MRNWACLPLKVAIIYSWRFQGFSNRAEKRAIVCKWTDIFTCNGRRNITYATLGAGLSDYAFQSKSNLYSPSPPFVSVCPGASTFIIDCSSYILYFSLPSAYVWWLKQLDICQTRYWTHNWNRNVLLLKNFGFPLLRFAGCTLQSCFNVIFKCLAGQFPKTWSCFRSTKKAKVSDNCLCLVYICRKMDTWHRTATSDRADIELEIHLLRNASNWETSINGHIFRHITVFIVAVCNFPVNLASKQCTSPWSVQLFLNLKVSVIWMLQCN